MPLAFVAIGGRQADLNTSGAIQPSRECDCGQKGYRCYGKTLSRGSVSGSSTRRSATSPTTRSSKRLSRPAFLAGHCFCAAFAFAAVGVLCVHRQPAFANRSPAFRGLQPFVVAMLVGYAAGLFSLTRNMVVPTYMILAMGAAYIRIALPVTPADYRLSPTRLRQMVLLGIGGLVFLKLFTQSLVQFGT